jgi:hypothetical protein
MKTYKISQSRSKHGDFGVLGSLVADLGETCYDIEPQACMKSCDREEMVSLWWAHHRSWCCDEILVYECLGEVR